MNDGTSIGGTDKKYKIYLEVSRNGSIIANDYSDNYFTISAADNSGVVLAGYTWYLGNPGQSCNTVCSAKGKTCNLTGTRDYAGSGGIWSNCNSILNTLGATTGNSMLGDWPANTGSGCYLEKRSGQTSQTVRDTYKTTTCEASFPTYSRACACN
jgi:hypothetical protein